MTSHRSSAVVDLCRGSSLATAARWSAATIRSARLAPSSSRRPLGATNARRRALVNGRKRPYLAERIGASEPERMRTAIDAQSYRNGSCASRLRSEVSSATAPCTAEWMPVASSTTAAVCLRECLRRELVREQRENGVARLGQRPAGPVQQRELVASSEHRALRQRVTHLRRLNPTSRAWRGPCLVLIGRSCIVPGVTGGARPRDR
jgi:hypothetical protein